MKPTAFPGVARSDTFLRVIEQARSFAAVPRPVLIRGERGTGKELLARYVHSVSPRADEPFVAVNCAAFAGQLLNSEIFGHEEGAFTGASKRHLGRLEQADGGTLFMDEIGNMSMAFQERILRVAEYQEFRRVGGTDPIRVDVRLVSATNSDLEDLMADGLFRKDLYDRQLKDEAGVDPAGMSTAERLTALRKHREELYSDLLSALYRLRGWTGEGRPTAKKLIGLGIDFPEVLDVVRSGG